MLINSFNTKVLTNQNVSIDLKNIINNYPKDKIFVIADENTYEKCLPIVSDILYDKSKIIKINSGEENKNIDTAKYLWKTFSNKFVDRSSLIINLGGGMICDLGGFAASTYKRGIDFINIPTTLLAQVDASVGGKVGVNYNHLKNEIGLFNSAKYVLVDTVFLKTLDKSNILSGFAEMIKHALIFDKEHLRKIMDFDIKSNSLNYIELNELIETSIKIKNHFVTQDFKEKNIRKALNFGHTIGHAIESVMLKANSFLLHGHAVAHGIIIELQLSNRLLGFDMQEMFRIINFISSLYGKIIIRPNDYLNLYNLIIHDKKNSDNNINCTLISDVGKIEINQKITKNQIFEAFNFYTQLNQNHEV